MIRSAWRRWLGALALLAAGLAFGHLYGNLLWGLGLAVCLLVVLTYLAVMVQEPDYLPPAAQNSSRPRQLRHANRQAVDASFGPTPLRGPASLLRPAAGTVAAQTPGKSHQAELETLLRTLATGPDYRRAPAAAALGLRCGGTSAPEVLGALLSVVVDEEAADLMRIEAIIALYRVLGESLPQALELELRSAFPSGVDWDFLQTCQRDLEKLLADDPASNSKS